MSINVYASKQNFTLVQMKWNTSVTAHIGDDNKFKTDSKQVGSEISVHLINTDVDETFTEPLDFYDEKFEFSSS